MIIKKLDIISFGKFQNKTIEFNPQLNIISGSNESGKSTIAAFITSMLYGFGDNRGKSLSFREKYMPWSASFLEGSLTLISDDGKEITIYRKAGLQKKHDILKIFDSLTGAELDITPVSLTDTDFESFSKTLFITQGKSSFNGSTEEISARLSRLLSGGEFEEDRAGGPRRRRQAHHLPHRRERHQGIPVRNPALRLGERLRAGKPHLHPLRPVQQLRRAAGAHPSLQPPMREPK